MGVKAMMHYPEKPHIRRCCIAGVHEPVGWWGSRTDRVSITASHREMRNDVGNHVTVQAVLGSLYTNWHISERNSKAFLIIHNARSDFD